VLFSQIFLDETVTIIQNIDAESVEAVAKGISAVKGRLFILGVGGSAAHASHAVNDFRKICGIEAYAPTDNVSELTARVNDNGWSSCFVEWLRVSRINSSDAVLVFSVGGGNELVSANIVRALELAKSVDARIFGIVSRDGGFTRSVADACVLIPVIYEGRITPHTEGICAVLWHLLVSHPVFQCKL
jgi:D-sedoheptulose 7-phosphate isomerase